jgi:5-methylcytosine-specific restriction endonuclease McrBC regulatory subunit McrC
VSPPSRQQAYQHRNPNPHRNDGSLPSVDNAIHVEEWGRIHLGVGGQQLPQPALARLLLDWQILTRTDPATYFDFGQGWLRPKNWVGSVTAAGRTIEVTPKGSAGLSKGEREVLDRNLGQMLEAAAGEYSMSLSSAHLSGVGSRFDRAVDGLCDLIQAARRTRTLREYTVREESNRNYRGRLRFPQHSLLEIRRPGYFHTTWAELHQDIAPNRFLRSVLDIAYSRTSGRVRRRVEGVLSDFDAVTSANPSVEYERIDLRRLPAPYSEAIALARALLDGHIPGLYAGDMEGASEVLLMPGLFEKFTARLFNDAARQLGLTASAQQHGRHLARWTSGPFDGRELVEIVPDVEVHAKPSVNPLLVADSKWKHLAPSRPGLDIDAGDVHQMLAYGVGLSCRRALLIYPWPAVEPPIPEVLSMRAGRADSHVEVTVAWLPLLWDRVEEATEVVRHHVEMLAA